MADKTKSQRTKDDPEQAKRFIETAREIGAAESKEEADRAFKKVVPAKRSSGDA